MTPMTALEVFNSLLSFCYLGGGTNRPGVRKSNANSAGVTDRKSTGSNSSNSSTSHVERSESRRVKVPPPPPPTEPKPKSKGNLLLPFF